MLAGMLGGQGPTWVSVTTQLDHEMQGSMRTQTPTMIMPQNRWTCSGIRTGSLRIPPYPQCIECIEHIDVSELGIQRPCSVPHDVICGLHVSWAGLPQGWWVLCVLCVLCVVGNWGPSLKVHHSQCLTRMTKHDWVLTTSGNPLHLWDRAPTGAQGFASGGWTQSLLTQE